MLLNGSDTDTFTQADLAAGRVAFQHDAGEDDGSITLSLSGGGGAAADRSRSRSRSIHTATTRRWRRRVARAATRTRPSPARRSRSTSTTRPNELTYSLARRERRRAARQHRDGCGRDRSSTRRTPSSAAPTCVTFRAVDAGGVESNSAVIVITVNPVKDAPGGSVRRARRSLTLENQGAVAIDPRSTVTDPDSHRPRGRDGRDHRPGFAPAGRARLRQPERHHRLVRRDDRRADADRRCRAWRAIRPRCARSPMRTRATIPRTRAHDQLRGRRRRRTGQPRRRHRDVHGGQRRAGQHRAGVRTTSRRTPNAALGGLVDHRCRRRCRHADHDARRSRTAR